MKLKEEMIISVATEFIGSADCPVKWLVNAVPRSESRVFESYGAEPEKHPYTIDKLPKAVQVFISKRTPRKLFTEGGGIAYYYD